MQFAVLTDIHANLPALQAIVRDLDTHFPAVDRVIANGDIVGRGAWPNEVLEVIRQREFEVVLGNYDDAIAFGREFSGADFASPEDEQRDLQQLAWTRAQLSQENLRYLQEMPRDVRLFTAGFGSSIRRNSREAEHRQQRRTFLSSLMFGSLLSPRKPPGARKIKEVLVVHGSTRALNEFLREDTARSIARRVAQDAKADLIVTGHSGDVYRQTVDDTMFVGSGSVSASGIPGLARYVVVTLADEVEVTTREVEYGAQPSARPATGADAGSAHEV